MIVFAVIVILVLSYFGISLRGILNSPEGKENVNFVTKTAVRLWESYLKEPAAYLMNNFVKPAVAFLYGDLSNMFIQSLTKNVKGMFSGNGSGLENMAPTLQLGDQTNQQPIFQ